MGKAWNGGKPAHLENLLGRDGGDDTGTTRGGDEADHDGAALGRDLHRDRVGLAELGAPVAAADGAHVHLGEVDGAADGRGHLLGALDAETDVAVEVADEDEGLEARALTGTRLLLDGHDLHHLVLERRRAQDCVDDLVLLRGTRLGIDRRRPPAWCS